MVDRFGPMSPQLAAALHFLASAGTAWALERRGYAERRWTGGEPRVIYCTNTGQEASEGLLGDREEWT